MRDPYPQANHLKPKLTQMYSSMIETGDTKWLYFGSKAGLYKLPYIHSLGKRLVSAPEPIIK
jgi:hypothetical protein